MGHGVSIHPDTDRRVCMKVDAFVGSDTTLGARAAIKRARSTIGKRFAMGHLAAMPSTEKASFSDIFTNAVEAGSGEASMSATKILFREADSSLVNDSSEVLWSQNQILPFTLTIGTLTGSFTSVSLISKILVRIAGTLACLKGSVALCCSKCFLGSDTKGRGDKKRCGPQG